jgi:hypothetical protein
MTDRHESEHKSFGSLDETRELPHVEPIAQTDSRKAPHFRHRVSGRLAIRMDDGRDMVVGRGDIASPIESSGHGRIQGGAR